MSYYFLSNGNKVAYLLTFFSNGFKHIVPANILWLDNLSNQVFAKLEKKIIVKTISPKTVISESSEASIALPEISIFNLKNAHLSPNSINIYLPEKESVVIERMPNDSIGYEDHRRGIIFECWQNQVLVFGQVDEVIDDGFYLSCDSPENYFHWLIEGLPKLYFFCQHNNLPTNTILVNEKVKNNSNLKQSLEVVLKGKPFRIKYLASDKLYKISNLYCMNSPNRVAYRMLYSNNFKADHFYQHPQTNKYFTFLKGEILESKVKKSIRKRIYLARNSRKRVFNQDNIIEILKMYDFEIVYPEKFSFTEQANLFSQADFVVGSTGAAWTNIIFCKKGTKALCWMPEMIENFSVYSHLSQSVGVDMNYLFYETKSMHGDYFLNPLEVIKSLKFLMNAQ